MSIPKEAISAEFIGTAGLLIVVVGSGIMAESLAPESPGLILLANSLATGAGLYALIQTFGPISGAHFNPAVSFADWWQGGLTLRNLQIYALAQILGAIAGVWATHYMFGLNLLQISNKNRGELRLLVSEAIATFGLLTVITICSRRNRNATPAAVALFIVSAYWCTSSTSFANPAVTIARTLTNTFTGIEWNGAPGFILAEAAGAGLALVIANFWLRA